MMKKKRRIWKRAVACGLSVLMAVSTVAPISGWLGLPTIGEVQAEESTTTERLANGTVERAPLEANLEELGNLGWIHFNQKDLSACAQSETSVISDIVLEGTMAQIMTDTDTNYIYTGSESDNHKGQVINQINGKTSFALSASTEERYVSVFTGSWASLIHLRVYINDVVVYENTHGKTTTTDGAESYLTSFSYHTESETDTVRVEILTEEVYNSYYGNQSIQAIAISDKAPEKEEVDESSLVTGTLESAVSRVNLTKQGNLDWIYMDTTDFGSFNRKNVLDPSITNMNLIGKCDYVTTNATTNYVYSDGMSEADSPNENHEGIVFTGTDIGFSFNVPASTETRCLDIYCGVWAADVQVTMTINDSEVYSKTFGSSNTTAGSPAQYRVLRLDYHTLTEEDTVEVTVKVAKQYSISYGNMNVSAITLGTARVEDNGSIAGGSVSTAPADSNLTEEGNLDWVYFNNADFAQAERKNTEEQQIANITSVGQAQSTPLAKNIKTTFTYSDGITVESDSGSNIGYVYVKEGSGVTFDLPASTDLKYVNVYTGEWAADVTLELLVNGNVEYSATYGSDVTTAGSPAVYNIARLKYKTASESDTVQIRALISKCYSTWGNMSISAVILSDVNPANLDETIMNDYWEVNHSGGEIQSLKTKIAGEMYEIPVRTDSYSGFAWRVDGAKIAMSGAVQDEEGGIVYTGRYLNNGKNLTVSLSYDTTEDNQLEITASLTNNQDVETAIERASIQFGFNTYLEKYPDYNDQLFPTLIRCEKTHAWGYFSTPSGRLMTIATDAPVASYTLHYQSGAHRIYSAALDVLQAGELPERHPEGLDHLAANETKTWKIYLKPVEELNAIEQVKSTIAESTPVVTFDADRYTLEMDTDAADITILSQSPLKDNQLTGEGPDGETFTIPLEETEGVYHATFASEGREAGVYRVFGENEDGYLSEMVLSIRNDWSWYIQQARKAAVEAPQKGTSHGESYYGLYSAYIAKKYFPNAEYDIAIDEKFEEIYPLMYDTETGLPTSWQNRIQNHSTTLGIFVDRYESSGNMKDIEQAVILADFLLSKQKEDGGYYNGSTDYTSVIYPAKSIMELTYVEKDLMNDESLSAEERAKWQENYNRHMASLTRAMDNLVSLDGHFQTEGQATFEDGANSCSATQLSEFALMFEQGSAEREKYTNAAKKIVDYHTSHQQSIIPDSRMNGGTLRFWEAQYDVEMQLTSDAPNMMNSPHGWSGWSIYALFNLYELTGDVSYLQRGMNAMGSCAQLMGFDGILRWAFIADPYRNTKMFVYDEENSTEEVIKGKHVETVIGEEYVDMISYWWRAPEDTWVPGYTAMGGSVTQGAACDNDVHEIFKAMGEVALTKAYVVENEDGTFTTYNATAEKKDDIIYVIPSEEVVSNISLNLKNDSEVQVNFYDGLKTAQVMAGSPVWVSTEENAVNTDDINKDCTLKSLTVEDAEISPSFDSNTLNYSTDIGENGGSVVIKAEPNNENAILYINGDRVEACEGYTVTMEGGLLEKTIEIIVKSEMQANEQSYFVKISSIGKYRILPTEELTATAGNEHSGSSVEGPASFLLDNNLETIWHTDWDGCDTSEHWVDIALNEAERVGGIKFLPRQSGTNGIITSYEIYLSNDNGETYTLAASGTWDTNVSWKAVTFEPQMATNVKLVALETVAEEYASGCEMRIAVLDFEYEEADYSAVDEAIEVANGLNKDLYKDFTAVEAAISAVVRGKNITEQSEVDAMAQAIHDAIAALELKPVEPTVDPADESKDVPTEMYTETAGSTQPGGSSGLATDGNYNTFWEVVWDMGNTNPEVLWYQIELSEAEELEAVRYYPRWGSNEGDQNGFITDYRIEVSMDGENWTIAAEGSWEMTEGWKIAEFDAVTAKYVRLVATGTYADVGNNSNMSIAEIRVKATGKVINKTNLKAAIEEAEGLTAEDYVDFSAVTAALAEAKEVEANADATQEEVNAAAERLNYAIGILERVAAPVTKEALEAAIDAAEAVDGALYTEESYVAVTEALAAAEAVYADADATQEEVDATAKALNDAVAALEEKPVVPEEDEVVRISGTTRYETGYKVADALKEELGVDKFDAIVVATGKNFADALAGSYLAVHKDAPIILTNGKDDNVAQLHEYIVANVTAGGKVYILGGDAAVPATVEAIEGYDVVRLSGPTRYDTNLAILEEAGIAGNELIVATGKNFADSLSASAVKLPILLVKPGAALNDAQKAVAEGMSKIYIIGGEGAVSADIEVELTAYADVVRVSGKTRYETSVAVANTFFADVEKSVVASAKNFPDGLCGGPLAAAMNAPLILTADGKTEAAAAYMAENAVEAGFVLGGVGAVADETVVDIFALGNADDIVQK